MVDFIILNGSVFLNLKAWSIYFLNNNWYSRKENNRKDQLGHAYKKADYTNELLRNKTLYDIVCICDKRLKLKIKLLMTQGVPRTERPKHKVIKGRYFCLHPVCVPHDGELGDQVQIQKRSWNRFRFSNIKLPSHRFVETTCTWAQSLTPLDFPP